MGEALSSDPVDKLFKVLSPFHQWLNWMWEVYGVEPNELLELFAFDVDGVREAYEREQ